MLVKSTCDKKAIFAMSILEADFPVSLNLNFQPCLGSQKSY